MKRIDDEAGGAQELDPLPVQKTEFKSAIGRSRAEHVALSRYSARWATERPSTDQMSPMRARVRRVFRDNRDSNAVTITDHDLPQGEF
jgi:hypothetical protein